MLCPDHKSSAKLMEFILDPKLFCLPASAGCHLRQNDGKCYELKVPAWTMSLYIIQITHFRIHHELEHNILPGVSGFD